MGPLRSGIFEIITVSIDAARPSTGPGPDLLCANAADARHPTVTAIHIVNRSSWCFWITIVSSTALSLHPALFMPKHFRAISLPTSEQGVAAQPGDGEVIETLCGS